MMVGAGRTESRSRTMHDDDPLFRSVQGALKFALNYQHGTLKKSGLAKLVSTTPGGRGLGGLDGAAQAGLIRAQLERLASMRRHLLTAKYGTMSLPCACRASCCRGWRESPDWAEAVNQLTQYALEAGLTGTISHYRLRRSLVTRYFGAGESFVVMAQRCGIDRHTASLYNKRVVERFRDEERKGLYELEGMLKDAAIIES